MNKILLYLYFITAPLYFISSGLPQMSELIMSLIFLLNILNIINIIFSKYSVSYSPFFIYVIVINLFFFYYTQDSTFILSSLFYVFNWIVVCLIIYLIITNEKKYLKTILYACMTSGVVQILLSLIVPSDSTRNTILFNNPNQLAEYAVMIVVLVLYCNTRLKGKTRINYTIMGIGLYLGYLSASKAGMISLLVISILFLILNSRSFFEKALSILISISLLVITYLVFSDSRLMYGINSQIDLIMTRFNHNKNHDEGIFLDRGYDRIIDFPEYIIFGSGEGYLERFDTNIELHSLFGTLLFSYGIFGLIFFMFILIFIVVKLPFKSYYLLIGPLLYTVTHQGLRETMLWILIALFISEIWKRSAIRKC